MAQTQPVRTKEKLISQFECGCKIIELLNVHLPDRNIHIIKYCPKHKSAPEMYEALKRISGAKRADARHDGSDARAFILIADKALAKAEGKE